MPNSFDFHTLAPMLRAFAASVTSEVAGHEIEMALDYNPDTWWQPTGTGNQDIVIDLGSGGSIITNVGDRDFSSAGNWSNVDLATFDQVTDLTITSSATNQFCTLAAAGLDTGFDEGAKYRIQYDYTERATGFQFRTQDQVIGALVAGTNQTLDWTVSDAGETELRVQATSASADGDVDNLAIIKLNDRLTVNGWTWALRNHTTDHGGSGAPRLNVDYSHDNNRYIAWNTGLWLSTWQGASRNLLIMGSDLAATQYRYFKFKLSAMESTMKLACLFLRRKTTVAQGSQFPERDTTHYFVKVQRQPGGITLKRLVNVNPISTKPRSWLLPLLTEKTNLDLVFQNSRGIGLPLILKEGSGTAELVNIIEESYVPNAIRHQMFRPQLTFRTLPFINPDRGF